MRRSIAAAGLVVNILALAAQLALTIAAFNQRGLPLLNAFIFNFAYFTVLSNLLAALVYAAHVWTAALWLGFFRRASTAGFTVAALLLVMVVATFILRRATRPEYFDLVEYVMHYVCPPLFLAWWGVFLADGGLRARLIPLWIVPMAGYLALIFLRGQIVSVYPYPFLNAAQLGWGRVFSYLGLMAVIYLALCAVTLVADRLIGARRRAT
jgi:hypothetical protein